MFVFILSCAVFLLLFILLQSIIYRSVIKKALRKYIEPELNEKGYWFIEYKWPGFLSSGDFKDLEMTLITDKSGSSFNDIYAYIYYKVGNDTKKITAKIETSFLSIKKVSYSSDL